MKSRLTVVLVVVLYFCLTGNAIAGFSDVQGHWAQKQVEEWACLGLTGGYPDGTFKPDSQITRSEFVALVNRACDKQDAGAEAEFTDVKPTKWYYRDVASAKKTGYIGGYPDGSFQPKNPITRQEAASILTRLLQLPAADTPSSFIDRARFGAWAGSSVDAVVAAGIMGGYPDGTFAPARPITRAEAVVTLDRSLSRTAPPVVQPPPAFEGVKGRVTLNGEPVSGATVRLFAVDEYWHLKETNTDAKGEYQFAQTPGSYDLTAIKDGCVAFASAVKVGTDTVQDLVLEPGTVLRGKLINEGSAVAHARLFLSTNPTFSTVTDGQGAFEITLPSNRLFKVRMFKNDDQSQELVVLLESVWVGGAGSQTLAPLAAPDDPIDTGTSAKRPPTLTASEDASVDGCFSLTFAADNRWEARVNRVRVDGVLLTEGIQYELEGGTLTLIPSTTEALQTAGLKRVSVEASGYRTARVDQFVNAGVVTRLDVDGWAPPAANGGLFDPQPVVRLYDQYDSLCSTGVSASALVVAEEMGVAFGEWQLIGETGGQASEGVVIYSDLTCTTQNPGSGCFLFNTMRPDSTQVSGTSDIFALPPLPPLAFVDASPIAAWTQDHTYAFAFTATGGAGTKTFAVTGGSLPDGLSLAANGALTGKPTAAGTFDFQVTVTDSQVPVQNTLAVDLSITVNPELVIGMSDPPNSVAWQPYSFDFGSEFSVSGGTGKRAFSYAGTLPPGLSLTTAGVLAGTPDTVGLYDFTVVVTDSVGAESEHAFNIAINPATAPTLTAAVDASVDDDFIILSDDATWLSVITGIKVNGTAVSKSAYEAGIGYITLKPSADAALQTAEWKEITIEALSYTNATVNQFIYHGAAFWSVEIVQPVPGESGAPFVTQPVVQVQDRYRNLCSTGVSSTLPVTARAYITSGEDWVLGGTKEQYAIGGEVTYTDLTCTTITPGKGLILYDFEGRQICSSESFVLP